MFSGTRRKLPTRLSEELPPRAWRQLQPSLQFCFMACGKYYQKGCPEFLGDSVRCERTVNLGVKMTYEQRRSQEFHWGVQYLEGADKRVATGNERVGKLFWNFCIEMVHFGTNVTDAVHHHWFLIRGYSEKTHLKLIFGINFGGGMNP